MNALITGILDQVHDRAADSFACFEKRSTTTGHSTKMFGAHDNIPVFDNSTFEVAYTFAWTWNLNVTGSQFTCVLKPGTSVVETDSEMAMWVSPSEIEWWHNGERLTPAAAASMGSYSISFNWRNRREPRGLRTLLEASRAA